MKTPLEAKLTAAFCAGMLFGGGWAIAKNRTITVLESSVVVKGAHLDVAKDGSCEAVVNIAAIADQREAQRRKLSADLCASLKAALLKNAKADQGLE